MLFSWILFICIFASSTFADRTFEIDYENHQFLKDGKPFRYIAGQIEYFRVQPELWQDRLMRLRHAGLNAIQIYVPWNFHETFENQFTFNGMANITAFIQLAQQQNLYVILRPGPYICAEWENGGLPYWLIKKKGIQLRVYNQPYIDAVENYYNHLMPLIKPFLYINDGPILMVQIENEYGSFGCDKKYLGFLRDLFKKLLGDKVVLYTSNSLNMHWRLPVNIYKNNSSADGPEEGMIKCGSVEGVFSTVDFRPVPENLIIQFFNLQQKYSKGGPMVNSEFYPGWFTMWGIKGPYLPSTKEVLDAMSVMYNLNASFTIYLMHGGTNYGFWNGAEPNGAIMTSYDWGAPVSENGGIRPMYTAIQDWIRKIPNWDHQPLSVPKNNSVRGYGKIKVRKFKNLLESFTTSNQKCHQSILPLSFEEMDHPYGFVLYRKELEFDGSNLTAENIKDHGFVYINDKAQGVLVDNLDKYSKKWISLPSAKKGDILTIIVENRGRQTYLSILDSKGLLPNVTLDDQVLTNWTQCPIDFGPTSKIIHATPSKIALMKAESTKDPFSPHNNSAGVYMGAFEIEGEIADTWFNPGKFRKGQLFINGNNVGRYWPSAGPQITLYVPASFLKKQNSVILIELLGRGPASTISFEDKPIYRTNSMKEQKQKIGRTNF